MATTSSDNVMRESETSVTGSNQQAARRAFLRRTAAVMLGGGAWMGGNTLAGSARAASAEYASLTDHKALVCVFLEGGCDTWSLFLPTEKNSYAAYAAARGALAVKPRDITTAGAGPAKAGFNALLGGLRKLYASGDVALVQNIGNLIAPVSRADYIAGKPWVPPGLFMHQQQQAHWLSATSARSPVRHDTGWAGRLADLLEDTRNNRQLPLGFSLAGESAWLTGDRSSALALRPGTLPGLDYFSDGNGDSARVATLEKILDLPRGHVLKQHASASIRRARSESAALRQILDQPYTAGTGAQDSVNQLADSLRMVAQLVAARDELGMSRQVFFVRHGGWDTHSGHSHRLAHLMTELDDALSGFYRTLAQQGLHDSVTLFTASEFGRALAAGNDGTDHGWGGHSLVLGGSVRGGQIHGTAPVLELGGVDDAGDKGRFIPSSSYNQLGAELARWMGLTEEDIHRVFPDLRYFDARGQLTLFNL